MITGLPIVFAAPAALAGLLALPALWWPLRLSPPRPERVIFPPLALILGLRNRDETPARLPWWPAVLRLGLALLVVLAAAGPAWQPDATRLAAKSGPLWLVVDNGFSAAPDGRTASPPPRRPSPKPAPPIGRRSSFPPPMAATSTLPPGPPTRSAAASRRFSRARGSRPATRSCRSSRTSPRARRRAKSSRWSRRETTVASPAGPSGFVSSPETRR